MMRSMTTNWKSRALQAEAKVTALTARISDLEARLASRPPVGRPPKSAPTEKSRLVDAACSRLGLSKGELAERLSRETGIQVDRAFLSPSREFSESHAEKLMAKLREWAGEEKSSA